ncbi:hypothetical protein AB4212_58575, partial [Streptomyces sp. 2MCAF27]
VVGHVQRVQSERDPLDPVVGGEGRDLLPEGEGLVPLAPAGRRRRCRVPVALPLAQPVSTAAATVNALTAAKALRAGRPGRRPGRGGRYAA